MTTVAKTNKKNRKGQLEKKEVVKSGRFRITEEVFNSITHGLGCLAAIAGLVLLVLKGIEVGSTIALVSYTIYGATLVALMLFSTLYHSLVFTKAKTVFQVFDHSFIYLLIAGTYTPFLLIVLHGPLGWTLFGIVWGLAIFGVVMKAIFLPRMSKVPKISTILYVIMGWIIIVAIVPLWRAMPLNGLFLLFGGGITYTLGAIIYSKKFPFAHVVWHVFVVVAALLMFLSVYLYV